MLIELKPNFNRFFLQTPVSVEYYFDVFEKKQLVACGYFNLETESYVLDYCDPFYVEEVNMFVKNYLNEIQLIKNMLECINE